VGSERRKEVVGAQVLEHKTCDAMTMRCAAVFVPTNPKHDPQRMMTGGGGGGGGGGCWSTSAAAAAMAKRRSE
jgi:hypothetical protein